MAPPRAGGPRRSNQPSEHIYTLGERGRKTGVTLRDTGVRDEHGMEPIDSIFSSPTKSRDGDAYDTDEDEVEEDAEEVEDDDEDDDDNGEADMDLTTASGPDPAALLNGQRSAARFAARQQTRSPAKALFGSPAVRGSASTATAAMRQNPLLRPPSSPQNTAAHNTSSPSKPVKRRLDFGKTTSANAQRRPFTLAPPNGAVAKHQAPQPPQLLRDEEDEDEDDAEENSLHGGQHYNDEDSMQMIGGPDTYDDDEPEPGTPDEEEHEDDEEDEEDEPARPAPSRRPGRPPAKGKAKAVSSLPPGPLQIVSSASKGAKRGRPGRNSGGSDNVPDEEEDDEGLQQQSAKRQRVAEEPKPKGRPRGRPPANRPQAGTAARAEESERQKDAPGEDAAPKKRGRKRKSSGVGAATAAAAAVPRGPPLPKSRDLVIRRREVNDSNDIVQTRSGRNSFRPLAFWRNEHVEFDPNDVQHDGLGRTQPGSRHFLLPSVKDIVRVDDEVLPPLATRMGAYANGGRRGGARRNQRRRRGSDGDEGDEGDDDHVPDRDPWETDPGKVAGDVVVWYPEHEFDPPGPGQDVEMTTAEIALSSAAIQTHEVRGGTFRFVKTLSMPFFGTGMVDMPPGSEKKLKNSRKMHMTFFVHYGQVVVKVHDSVFRISKGGMWSVPRGNYYSITNYTDHPARVFFAQGCEVLTTLDEDEEGSRGEGD